MKTMGFSPQTSGGISGSGRGGSIEETSATKFPAKRLGCLKPISFEIPRNESISHQLERKFIFPTAFGWDILVVGRVFTWWSGGFWPFTSPTIQRTSHAEETFLHILNREPHLKVSKVCLLTTWHKRPLLRTLQAASLQSRLFHIWVDTNNMCPVWNGRAISFLGGSYCWCLDVFGTTHQIQWLKL